MPPPTVPTRDSSRQFTRLVLACSAAAIQAAGAILLSLYGWAEHYGYLTDGLHFRSGPYFLLAAGFLIGGWGCVWRRLWTVPVIAAVIACVGFILCRGIVELPPQNGPYALLGFLEMLVIGLLLSGCLTVQAACLALIVWPQTKRYLASLRAGSISLEAAEAGVAVLAAALLWHFDYRVPARLQAQRRAASAVQEAQSDAR